MKVGDLVTDEFYEDVGIIVSRPRLSEDCGPSLRFDSTEGDVYEVVDVLCPDGCVRQFTTDELWIISESR